MPPATPGSKRMSVPHLSPSHAHPQNQDQQEHPYLETGRRPFAFYEPTPPPETVHVQNRPKGIDRGMAWWWGWCVFMSSAL